MDAVRGQLAEIEQGHLEQAYARLTTQAQSEMSFDDFQRLVEEHPALRDHSGSPSWLPDGSVNIVNDHATVKRTLVTSGGTRVDATFELVKEAGAWKISGIRLESD
jgi:hypothetical protein